MFFSLGSRVFRYSKHLFEQVGVCCKNPFAIIETLCFSLKAQILIVFCYGSGR